MNNELTDLRVKSLANSGDNIFAGTWYGSNGMFLSTNNGLAWTAVNNELEYTYIQSLSVLGTNIYTLSTQNESIYKKLIIQYYAIERLKSSA